MIGNQTSGENGVANTEAGFLIVLNFSIVISRALHHICVPGHCRHIVEGVLAL